MEDKGLGNIIFYIILAIIALAGSFLGKKKKASGPGAPKPSPEPVQVSSADEPQRRSPYSGLDPRNEGRYEEPMAGAFTGEGSYSDPLAERFSKEGSMADDLAARFSMEGSIEGTMAAAFATEGMSSMTEMQIRMSTDTAISDGEIGDAAVYDYNAVADDLDLNSGFDIRKAVIYSALLNRKEYTF